MQPTANLSLAARARLAGLFYLLVIVTAPLALAILGRIVVTGDPAATVANILAHETLFRLGFISDLLSDVFYLVVTVFFYQLFKPAGRTLSLLGAAFSFVGIAMGAVSLVFRLVPLSILNATSHLGAFPLDQLQALAVFCLKLRAEAVNIGIVFFGFYCLCIGCLILRSSFLPRLLGAGMCLAGLGWLTFLYAPLAASLSPTAQICGGLGEISLTLFLLFAGVNTERWNRQALEAEQRRPL